MMTPKAVTMSIAAEIQPIRSQKKTKNITLLMKWKWMLVTFGSVNFLMLKRTLNSCQVSWSKLVVFWLNKSMLLPKRESKIIKEIIWPELFMKEDNMLEDCFIISPSLKKEPQKETGADGTMIMVLWLLLLQQCTSMLKENKYLFKNQRVDFMPKIDLLKWPEFQFQPTCVPSNSVKSLKLSVAVIFRLHHIV